MLQFKRIPKNGNVFITTLSFQLLFTFGSRKHTLYFGLNSDLVWRRRKQNKRKQREKKSAKRKKSESGIDPQNGFSRGHRAERGGKHTKKSDSNQATINFALIEQLHSLGSMIVGSVGDGGGSLEIGREWERKDHEVYWSTVESIPLGRHHPSMTEARYHLSHYYGLINIL